MTEPDNEFEAYSTLVREYASSWYLLDHAAVDTLKKNPRARAAALGLGAARLTVGTDIVYLLQPDRWMPARAAFHDAIVSQLVPDDGDRGPLALPVAVLLMGLPGSGKSSRLRPMARELCRRVGAAPERVVDSDDVRGLLPEYAEGLGSEVVQVETSFVAYRKLVEATYGVGGHVILDTVGDPDLSIREAQYLTDAGWSVACMCAHIDVEVAVQRVVRRALTDGRFVSPGYVRAVGDRPVRAYHALIASGVPLVGAALLDTSGDELSPPVVIDTTQEDLFGRPEAPAVLWPGSFESESAAS